MLLGQSLGVVYTAKRSKLGSKFPSSKRNLLKKEFDDSISTWSSGMYTAYNGHQRVST
jgi:hypothetical protein